MTKRVSSPKPAKPVTKERAGLLSTALILIMMRNILAAIVIFSLRAQDNVSTPLWVASLLGLLALADVVAGVAIWNWKKWGITLYVISSIAASAIGLMLTGSLLVIFHGVLMPAILAYILSMQNKWRNFD